MFASFRRHQKWIWVLAVIVVVPTMVVFFTDTKSFTDGGNRAQGDFGSIGGRPITREEYLNARRELYLSYFFRSGTWPDTDANTAKSLERETPYRVFLLQKLKDMDVAVSQRAVARVVQERIRDYPYDKLETEFLRPHGLTLLDFDRFIQHEAAIQQLVGTASMSARLSSPKEAEEIFRREHEETTVEVVPFWATNYMDQIKAAPEDIGRYFTNQMARYRIPERVQVAYVQFSPTNYFAEADKKMAERTNITQSIDEEYLRAGTNTFKDTNGNVLTAAAAKAKIREDYRFAFGYGEARRAAADFGTKLSKQPNPYAAENLEKLAAAEGLPSKVTQPLDALTTLDDETFPPDFKRKALAFTDEKPIEWTPIPGTNAIYVIARKKKIPSEAPSFETIKEKVAADYKHSEALTLAMKAGPAFHTNLTNGLALNKPFKDLCAEAKVTPISLPPFSMSSEPLTNIDTRLNFNMVRNLGLYTDPGKASPFIQSSEGGIVVYVQGRAPVAPDKLQKELPEFINRLRQERQGEAFNQWFRKEIEAAKVATPREDAPAQPAPKAAPRPAAPAPPKPKL